MTVKDFQLRDEIGALRGEIGGAFGGRLFRILEHRNIRRIERSEQPIHPALHVGTLGWRSAGQMRRVQRGYVAQDGVRFPGY
jgi:hypothetical protein